MVPSKKNGLMWEFRNLFQKFKIIKTFKRRASKATKRNTLDSASLQHIDSLNFNIDQKPSKSFFFLEDWYYWLGAVRFQSGNEMFLYSDFEEFTWVEGSFSDQGDWSMGSPSRRQGCTTALENIGYMRWWEEITLIINENNFSAGSFAHRGKPADCVGVCPGFDLGDKLFSI